MADVGAQPTPGPPSSRPGPTLGLRPGRGVQQRSQERREAVGWASASPGAARAREPGIALGGWFRAWACRVGSERRGLGPCCAGRPVASPLVSRLVVT